MAAKDPVLPASKTLIHLADRAVLLHFNRTIHKQQEESPRIVMTPGETLQQCLPSRSKGHGPSLGK